ADPTPVRTDRFVHRVPYRHDPPADTCRPDRRTRRRAQHHRSRKPRWRFGSTNMSSASPPVSTSATTEPSVLDSTSRRAGLRNATRTRRVSSSIAIGKFARWPVCGQGSDLFTLLQIDHGYLTGIWNIDESAGAAFFNLKTLRMRLKSDVGDLFAGARVDQSKRTLSIS